MKHILIVNQHGENRGDEAAMRAMLARFKEELGEVRFTLLYQFRDRQLRLAFNEGVEDLPIVLPVLSYLSLLAFTVGKVLGLSLTFVLSPTMRKIIAAYERTDLVVSAPGGPYFGDIYANHEIFHWWYVWLGRLFRKPVFLYATSAGPFRNRLLNPIRKTMYRKFAQIVVREEFSAKYIRDLLGPDSQVEVTADSAIQVSLTAYPRDRYFVGERASLAHKFLVAVSLNNYSYPGAADPEALRQNYNKVMTELLTYLAEQRDCHFLFLPQLYGTAHSDVPFLREMGNSLPAQVSWEIVDPLADSDMQRRLFAMCDLHLASRYHPAIFGNTGLVPGLCIYYEHKALGFMQQLGLEHFAVDIRKLDIDQMRALIDELLQNRDEIVRHLERSVPQLRLRARRTTELAVGLIRESQPPIATMGEALGR